MLSSCIQTKIKFNSSQTQPAVFGDGSFQMMQLLEGALEGNYTSNQLAKIIFAKMFCLGMCQGFGFIGGQC